MLEMNPKNWIIQRKSNHLVVYSLFAFVLCAYLVMAIKFPMAYIWATYEDLFGEWLQFWFFMTTMIFSARLALAPSRYRLFFGILAFCCFYVAMEEISWGQRILDLQTPDFFRKHNIQKEINIHNLFTGPVVTPTKAAIEYAFAGGLVFYGVCYPIALERGLSVARWIEKRGLPAPPIYLWPFFLAGALLDIQIFSFNEAEVAEILISLALSLLAIHYWILHRSEAGSLKKNLKNRTLSGIRADHIVAIFLAVILLSFGSTFASYASVKNRLRIEKRILNGVEKFAERYVRFGMWQTAAQLYLQVHQREPHRTSILRELATCYREMGDEERFEFFNSKALETALEQYRRKPRSVLVNLSLAETYKQRGKVSQAKQHLQKALEVALERVTRKPKSAAAAYWLGLTYELKGDDASALEEFRRASELNPYNIRYKRAQQRTLIAIESATPDSE
jgi:tetratricopeptide (TPR) repeat protein